MDFIGNNRYGREWTAQDRINQMGNPGASQGPVPPRGGNRRASQGPVPPGRGSSPREHRNNPIRSPLNRNRLSRAFNYSPLIPPTPPPDYRQTPPPQYIPTQPGPQQNNPPGSPQELFKSGWRVAVVLSAIAITLIFMINLGLTIWAGRNYRTIEGLGTIYEGKCNVAKKYGTLIHLAINCAATVLLFASNYTMQCLSAPTREDIDREHARKRWLDIGVSSIRNLNKLSRGRIVLWWLLGLSSIPLHLIYNSAIFSSLSTNAYVVDVVAVNAVDTYLKNATAIAGLSRDNGVFIEIDKVTCMETYGRQFISDRRDVLVVVDHTEGYHTPEHHGLHTAGTNTERTPYDWICDSVNIDHSKSCDINNALLARDTWKMNGGNVLYCLSEEKDEKCSLQYSLHIMLVVIIFNGVKVVCMVLAVMISKEDPLVTIGDAIASFLKDKDVTTSKMCIFRKEDITRGHWGSKNDVRQSPAVIQWKKRKPRWFGSASRLRWALCYILSLASIAAAICFLVYGMNRRDFWIIWRMGFGSVNIHALAEVTNGSDRGYKGIIKSIILANIPQTIFSTLYLLYNSIFTCMQLGAEWDSYSKERKGLRVTQKSGTHQRSSYFLQIPYRYGIPLLLGSVIMHWLISQSIFLARVIEFRDGVETEDSISTTGYSPIPIICAIALGLFMLLVLFLMGFRKYSGNIPMVASCSAAISAACHTTEINASSGLLLWGVVPTSNSDGSGHCTFSTQNAPNVTAPVEGKIYSGIFLEEENISVD